MKRDQSPVVLCYDGSEHAERAITSAGTLLRPTRATVVHVRNAPGPHAVADAGRRVALAAGFGPVAAEEAGPGRVASVLLQEAHARSAKVIVLGSRGHTSGPSPVLGDVADALLHESDVPLLVVGAGVPRSPANGPVFLCYDGSPIARRALPTASALLARRAAIVASFIPSVDDGAVLNARLPWPAAGATQDRLAQMDRQEAEAPDRRATEGARAAEAAGFAARPLGLSAAGASGEEEEEPWRRLLRAADDEDAACIVVAHRHSVPPPASAAHALIHHAERPVLVVPGSGSRRG